ncbi:copper sensory histidine kinase [Lasius niger]|uniref:Copper sensory histidine kinase n=1 Tax=Lasius niger TaxID=67767 RepID=A0A0J7KDK9_LASNI|nr:copper sensory histidine kinase [Lasius niger]
MKRRLQRISNDESMSAMDIDDNSETDSNKRLYGDACDELEPPCPPLFLQCTEMMEVSQGYPNNLSVNGSEHKDKDGDSDDNDNNNVINQI